LDLSDNKFECNDDTIRFYIMMEAGPPDKKRPEAVDWDGGNGYVCKNEKEEKKTFKQFAEDGMVSSNHLNYNERDFIIWETCRLGLLEVVGDVD
jgi:hypothetical protein